MIVPESSDWDVQLACLTAAGYADKYYFVSKILPNFSEQLVWKEVVNMLHPSHNYIYLKAFYSVLNY